MQQRNRARGPASAWAVLPTLLLSACLDNAGRETAGDGSAQSCMRCHNGSHENDYAGPGLQDPHPFPGAERLTCTTCHGGDPSGTDKVTSHVPPPPEIGDREFQATNARAYFNRLTLTGIDKFPDYQSEGTTYKALDYLQFINPGDLRVVNDGRGCGQCHAPHAEKVSGSLLATAAGMFSGASYTLGVDNFVPENRLLFQDTAADLGFRGVFDPTYVVGNPDQVGHIGTLIEYPVYSVRGINGPGQIFQNPAYDAANLPAHVDPTDGSVLSDSPLAHLFMEQVAFTCGDCHLGSAGANNRAGDYRSSGCTACHMPYSLSGRSGSRDPNVDKLEPLDPDDIDEPERAHIRSHRIVSVKRVLANGVANEGIDDHTCAGCHQGSNRTVMQYWGIRLDQNQDLRNRVQYPANPVTFRNTNNDPRLFDPVAGNNTFNGRNRNQYIAFEDYDGDGRDDTPADVHYEAGMGCIDCHGSYDLHGGDVNSPTGQVMSRMEHGVAIKCTDCHGTPSTYAATVAGLSYLGVAGPIGIDSRGNAMRHVTLETNGNYYLTSRLSGKKLFIPQTRDTIVDSGKLHPESNQPVYTDHASYAMGRDDGNDTGTGIGPRQAGTTPGGFSHMDNLSCEACHSSWTNTCMGCHLEGEYDNGNNFSNITGERIVFRERFAEFVYQSPVMFQLGVGPDNKIKQTSANTKTFFRWKDRNNDRSKVFTFSDRSGRGSNPGVTHPSLSHNAMLAHSIRGRVSATDEGPRYCVACHLTNEGLTTHRTLYDGFRTAIDSGNYGALDFEQLRDHIGRNPGNQRNSPLWVHMVAGLGSGLFLFDANGAAVNPLDDNDDRYGSDGQSPADTFNPALVHYDLDRIVLPSGIATGSSTHPMLEPGAVPNLRDGAANPNMAGPLGAGLIFRLTDPTGGIVLDSWVDADRAVQGAAGTWIQ